jgi:ABC-type polysaccharide/polyol phosphate export permease
MPAELPRGACASAGAPGRPRAIPRDPVLPFRAVTSRSEASASLRSSSVRPGSLELIQIGIRDVLSRRRLIAYLVRADLKKRGADTLLGNVWWVVDPLLQMMVYFVFMAIILQRSTPDFPLFLFAGILPWKWFDSTLKDGITAIVARERLIKQIYFPKLVLPLATTMAGVVSFGFGLIPLVAITAVFYPHRLTAWFLLIPAVAVVQLVFSLALAIFLSALTVFYRDVNNLARHVVRMWFLLSPILYGTKLVEVVTRDYPSVAGVLALNPWTYLADAYHKLIYEGRAPDWASLAVLLVVSVGLLLVAVLGFKRAEPAFAKVL